MTQGKERLAGATHPPWGLPATTSALAWEPAEGMSCLSSLTSKPQGEHNDVRNAKLPAPCGWPHVSLGVNNAA